MDTPGVDMRNMDMYGRGGHYSENIIERLALLTLCRASIYGEGKYTVSFLRLLPHKSSAFSIQYVPTFYFSTTSGYTVLATLPEHPETVLIDLAHA